MCSVSRTARASAWKGEREFSPETVTRFGKRDGYYGAGETKLEYEFTPNQYVQFELGPMVAWHTIWLTWSFASAAYEEVKEILGKMLFWQYEFKGESIGLAVQ